VLMKWGDSFENLVNMFHVINLFVGTRWLQYTTILKKGAERMIFEPITEKSLEVVLEIVNSNTAYNLLEVGSPLRTMKQVSDEFLNPMTESFLIVHDNKYIGVIDFLKNNPKDNCPWIGLLMIHNDYHSKGYGKKAYVSFEEKLKRQNFTKVRLGVLQENLVALAFWKSLGFKFYGTSTWQDKTVDCFEKHLQLV
jgi:GNAT superfamily N-acetyltransferase